MPRKSSNQNPQKVKTQILREEAHQASRKRQQQKQQIGKAIAIAFAREGSHLVLVARNRPELEIAKKEVEDHGTRIEIFPADVSQEKEVNMKTYAKVHLHGLLQRKRGDRL